MFGSSLSGLSKIRRHGVRASTLATLAVLPVLIGCASEFKRDGGLVGAIENNVMEAPNRPWQTYRAAVFLMLLSAVAEANLKDTNSITSFYFAAAAVRDDINDLAGHIYPQYYWWTWNFEGRDKAWTTPDRDGTVLADKPSTPQAIGGKTGYLLPCPNYANCSSSSTDPNDAYRYKNYVGMFNADLPKLNDHLFKAAASSVRQDKFVKLIQDASQAGAIGGPTTIAWGVLKDLFDVSGEILDAEAHFAAAWRSELDNSAAIVTAANGPKQFPGCTKATDADFTNCVGRVTTEDAVNAFSSRKPTKEIVVPIEAFDPIYAAIRNSCAAIVGKLPPKADPKGPPMLSQESADCTQFMLAPNVYRKSLQGQKLPIRAGG